MWMGKIMQDLTLVRKCLLFMGRLKKYGQQKGEIGITALQGDWRYAIRPNAERAFQLIEVRNRLLGRHCDVKVSTEVNRITETESIVENPETIKERGENEGFPNYGHKSRFPESPKNFHSLSQSSLWLHKACY